MKKLIRLILALGMIAFVLGFFILLGHGAESVPPAAAAASTGNLTAPDDLNTQLTSLLTAHPRVAAALALFATLSGLYQVLIAFAHKRAAESTSPADDKWIADLEAKRWFRVLDRVFYWGGYLGAWGGGKKL
jgi:hypothetical protein